MSYTAAQAGDTVCIFPVLAKKCSPGPHMCDHTAALQFLPLGSGAGAFCDVLPSGSAGSAGAQG